MVATPYYPQRGDRLFGRARLALFGILGACGFRHQRGKIVARRAERKLRSSLLHEHFRL